MISFQNRHNRKSFMNKILTLVCFIITIILNFSTYLFKTDIAEKCFMNKLLTFVSFILTIILNFSTVACVFQEHISRNTLKFNKDFHPLCKKDEKCKNERKLLKFMVIPYPNILFDIPQHSFWYKYMHKRLSNRMVLIFSFCFVYSKYMNHNSGKTFDQNTKSFIVLLKRV